MPLSLVVAVAVLVAGPAIAAVLHPHVFPLDEPRRELRLDEHLRELVSARKRRKDCV